VQAVFRLRGVLCEERDAVVRVGGQVADELGAGAAEEGVVAEEEVFDVGGREGEDWGRDGGGVWGGGDDVGEGEEGLEDGEEGARGVVGGGWGEEGEEGADGG